MTENKDGNSGILGEDEKMERKSPLPPAAQRALSEAAARKAGTQQSAAGNIKEIGGRKEGCDPTRYGDWELKGRAIDF